MDRTDCRPLFRGVLAALAWVVLACGVLSGCGNDAQTTDGRTGGGTVLGNFYPPLSLPGPWSVRLATDVSTVATPVAETTGTTNGTNVLDYEIDHVPAGAYYILILVDLDGSGGADPTAGDEVGWCNPLDYGNPPAAPNVFVRDSVSGRYDCNLVVH
jgi:hypothetical protein